MPEITLYFAPQSRSIRALWLLEEIGAPFDLVPLSLAARRPQGARSS